MSAAEAGLADTRTYRVRDLWTHTDLSMTGTIHAEVPARGTVKYRLSMDVPR